MFLKSFLKVMIVVSLFIAVVSGSSAWAAARVAYIFNTDTASRDNFNTFLTGRNFVVDLVPLSNAATFDFSSDQAIIIGDDTGDTSTWGTPAAVTNINGAGKPIMGIGEGGYAFFGKLLLDIGYGNGWHGPQSGADIVDTANPVWDSPLLIPNGGIGSTVTLYNTGVNSVAIDNPSVVPGVIRLAIQTGDQTHYLLIDQVVGNQCYALWGFSGSPAGMTSVGHDLFYNDLARPCGAAILNGLTTTTTTSVPTMTEYGMIIFMLLAGLGSVHYLGRRKTPQA